MDIERPEVLIETPDVRREKHRRTPFVEIWMGKKDATENMADDFAASG